MPKKPQAIVIGEDQLAVIISKGYEAGRMADLRAREEHAHALRVELSNMRNEMLVRMGALQKAMEAVVAGLANTNATIDKKMRRKRK